MVRFSDNTWEEKNYPYLKSSKLLPKLTPEILNVYCQLQIGLFELTPFQKTYCELRICYGGSLQSGHKI